MLSAAGPQPQQQYAGGSHPAQPFLNLDFERATPQGMPVNWYIEAERTPGVTVALDGLHVRSGRTAMRLASNTTEPVPLYTPLFLEPACHREVSLGGSVHADRRGAALIPILFSPGGRRAIGKPLALTATDWQSFRHHMESAPGECLPPDLKAGFLFQGPGEAWIDGLSVTIDGREWGTGEPPVAPSRADIRALASAAIDLQDYAPGASGPARERAAAVFRLARVIALGENTHGAASLFRMKLDLIRFLVQEQNCTVVALEAPAVEADKVNDYVQGRTSDGKAALDALVYPSWQTEEMRLVVEWLREHNRTAGAAVQFRGFDVQQPRFALSAAEPLIAAAVDRVSTASLTALRHAITAGPSDRAKALAEVATLDRRLSTSDALSPTARQRLSRYLRILERGLRMDAPELNGKTRDAYMADEVMDLVGEIGAAGRLVLWADNTHVTYAGRAMGAYLREQLRDRYLSVGSTFNRGYYSAYGPDRRYPVQEGFPGTHEYLLSRRGPGSYLVPLRALPASHALRQIAAFRYIGSRPQMLNQFQPHRLDEHFDVIGYVDSTESTRFLFNPIFE